MHKLVEDLHKKREKIYLGGGQEEIDKQHERGKLTARERLTLLFDEGTFMEMGLHAHHQSANPQMKGKKTPADGVITGYGEINGRMVACCAYDFTVMAGSMGAVGEFKVTELRKYAVQKRIPFVWLLDSAGARIQEATGSQFAGSGYLFFEESIMSGSIPLVSAVMGPCAAGTAYIPGLSDVVFMVKETGSMALAGAHLVKAAIGEDSDDQTIGGSTVHCEHSGVGDLEAEDDHECIDFIKTYLSFFPSCYEEKTPPIPTDDPIDRQEEALLDIIPDDPKKPYDIKDVISLIVDDGYFFELKPAFAKNLVIAFARMDGESVGIIANQPNWFGGIIDNDAADKAARFINLCDSFNIPLIFLQDTPGFMVGSRVEKQGIIRHGAKMVYSVSNANVPKITVILRKAYGAGYFAMCGKAYEPDLIVAWPTAEISVMGPEGAVNIIFRKQIASSPNPDQTRQQMIAMFKSLINPYLAAGFGYIDDVIDPRETRKTIIQGLRGARKKKVDRPPRKHGVMPV